MCLKNAAEHTSVEGCLNFTVFGLNRTELTVNPDEFRQAVSLREV